MSGGEDLFDFGLTQSFDVYQILVSQSSII